MIRIKVNRDVIATLDQGRIESDDDRMRAFLRQRYQDWLDDVSPGPWLPDADLEFAKVLREEFGFTIDTSEYVRDRARAVPETHRD